MKKINGKLEFREQYRYYTNIAKAYFKNRFSTDEHFRMTRADFDSSSRAIKNVKQSSI